MGIERSGSSKRCCTHSLWTPQMERGGASKIYRFSKVIETTTGWSRETIDGMIDHINKKHNVDVVAMVKEQIRMS